jgi:uncharacterized membrane protein
MCTEAEQRMQIVILFLGTAIPFAVLDALMLSVVMQPLFQRHIGALMLDTPRLAPAALFYLGYVAGLVVLVGLPALRAGSVGQAALNGAILGAIAYGTYELTSHAIMRDWHPSMVLTDLAWGTILTAVSAAAGVAVTRWLMPG